MASGDTPTPPRPKLPTDDQATMDYGTAPGARNSEANPAGTLLKDRYLLIRHLNEGGFGTVHLAHDQQLHGRPVVVKIQTNPSPDDPWFERKFNEEVRALSMIDHPGVVVAIDSGRTPDGRPFLVMQYVDGVTLRAVMAPEGMPLERAAEILKQVGHALGAAHDKGIWHRDLKPENLMLQHSGETAERVRLIDFGIATVVDMRTRQQPTTRVAGSFSYMAPEQALGQASAATDIYAMGLIAYEVVTGRKPFVAEGPVQLAGLQKAGVRVKPSDLRPALPAAAERLIMQSLEYEPAKRPRDARIFGDCLRDALLSSDVTRLTVERPERKRDRPRGRYAAIGLIVLGIVFGKSILDRDRKTDSSARRSEPTKPLASAPPAQETPPPAQEVKDSSSEQAIELAYWNSVKDSTEPELYRDYLAKYPEGRFASLAKAKLTILARKASSPSKPLAKEEKEDVELAMWNSVKDSEDPQLFQEYLDKYPRGQFEKVARRKLDLLTKHGGRGGHRGEAQDIAALAAINPKMAAELKDWNALQHSTDPQAYRDFMNKYPGGLFASLAKLKIDSIVKKGVKGEMPLDIPMPPIPPFGVDADDRPVRDRGAVRPRPAVDPDDYSGPRQGELHWTGTLARGGALVIVAGKSMNGGTLTGDLPRVPVDCSISMPGVRILDAPNPRNHWDRILVLNSSPANLSDLVISWKVKD